MILLTNDEGNMKIIFIRLNFQLSDKSEFYPVRGN